MTAGIQRYQLPGLALFGLAVAHGLVTWPLAPTLALFVGGVVIATLLEVIGVQAGLLRHRFRPRVAGVPVTIILGWPTVTYLFYRVALVVLPVGVGAAGLAATLATLSDVVVDPVMVRRGAWEYPESPISRPRVGGVPWWNFAAWPAAVFVTALIPTVVMM